MGVPNAAGVPASVMGVLPVVGVVGILTMMGVPNVVGVVGVPVDTGGCPE